MADVLIGWEMGAGLGHVMPVLEIARRLRDRGHNPILALRNLVEGSKLVREAGFIAVQSPLWQMPPHKGRHFPPTASLADILYAVGLNDCEHILPVLEAWDALINLVKPKLVIAEFAPALCLAARGRLPLIALGNGFAMPPSHLDEFPVLQPGVPPLVRQADLLAEFNKAMAARGEPPLPRLPAIFEGDEMFVCALRELDPYGSLRKTPAQGYNEPLPPRKAPTTEKRVFAYLGVEFPFVRQVVDGLAASNLPVTAFLRGVPAAARERWNQSRITFLDSPPKLADALEQAAVAMHYAGGGTTSACLSAGRPQLALPRQVERRLNAAALERLGVGLVIPGRTTPQQVASMLHRIIDDPGFASRAQAVATRIHERGDPDVLELIAEHSVALIEQG